MPAFITRYGLLSILIAVFLEELGIPMPIPTDILIVFGGVMTGPHPWSLIVAFLLLTVASTLGASGLYAVVRRGGRPMVTKYGRYIHLGPHQLDRAERLLQRGGWGGIAVGRAIPGLRMVTVIACGLLNVPYFRFMTAHMVGSSVYILLFLLLGAYVGPTVIDSIHVPSHLLRLLWLIILAVGIPVLVVWLCSRAHLEKYAEPSRRRVLGAVLSASLLGGCVLMAIWAVSTTVTHMLGTPRPLDIAQLLSQWMLGRGVRAVRAYILIYGGLTTFCLLIGVAYYSFLLPAFQRTRVVLWRQVLELTLLGGGVIAAIVVPLMLAGGPQGAVWRWWQASGPLLALVLALGTLGFAITTVYGRALVIATLPTRGRSLRTGQPAPPPANQEPATDQRRTSPEQSSPLS